MNRLLAGITTAVALTAMVATAQQGVDVSGYVVTAYKVDGDSFARDGRISSFWNDWSNKDQINMTPAANGWTDVTSTFSGESDANLKVRCAYDVNALYLQYDVVDDLWFAQNGYGNDDVDILLDKISSAVLMDPGSRYTLYIRPETFWSLTYYTVQYQINMGAAGAVLSSVVQMNYFAGSGLTRNTVNLTELNVPGGDYVGWDLDITSVSSNNRVMEWKVPWNWVGCSGGIGSMPAEGTLIAISGGYNDKDSDTQAGRKSLRWREKDPFNETNGTFSNAWGDIVIGPRTAVNHHQGKIPAISKATSTQYFTVKGEMLTGSQMKNLRQGTMVVQRSVVNGQNVSKMIRTK